MNMITPIVVIMDSHLLQFTGNVISCTTVHVPICINIIAYGSCSCGLGVLLLIFIFIIAVPACWSLMPDLLAYLALGLVLPLAASFGGSPTSCIGVGTWRTPSTTPATAIASASARIAVSSASKVS